MFRPIAKLLLPVLMIGAGAAGFASAEVIRLKNGRAIRADTVRDTGARVEYTVGEDTYAVAKSLVETIDTGKAPEGSRPAAAESASESAPPLPPLEDPATEATLLPGEIFREGRVSEQALLDIERTGPPVQAAHAYLAAARFEMDREQFEPARRYLERAQAASPDNHVILEHYAALMIQAGQFADALKPAEEAVRLAPASADARALAGVAAFQLGRTRDAIDNLRESLKLRPNPGVKKYLELAERESKTEANFREQDTGRFTIRYEGESTSEDLRRELIAALDRNYNDLVRELGVSPRDPVQVVLYTNQAFFDVTRAPGWTGALNDGKLRIPIEGLPRVSPELNRVLRHELAHSFIQTLSHGRCPVWLHEGVAQLLEPGSSRTLGGKLGFIYKNKLNLPLNSLEGSFFNFDQQKVALAYAQSLATVEYLHDRYGMSDVVRILQRIGEGQSTESALRGTVRSGYAQLEAEVAGWITGQ